MRITVLGSGDAFASGSRRQSAYLVESSAATFLMDAGPTVLAGLKAAAVSPSVIDFVVLSHLHGDHFSGLVFLFIEYLYETPRTRPLTIAGPAGTEERVRDLHRAMYKEGSARTLPYSVRFETLEADRPTEIGGVRVEPFAVPHQEREPSLGMRIAVDGKAVVYSGDSAWTEEFVRRTRGADLFLCECCYWESDAPIHVRYPEIEEHRARLGAKRLVLTHLGSEMIAKLDRVAVECAYDGMVIEL